MNAAQALSPISTPTQLFSTPLQGKSPLDANVAERLLDLLSTDNTFRRLFKKDPLAALVQAGYVFAIQSENNRQHEVQFLPFLRCLIVGKLASKKEISRSREQIRGFLTSAGTHTVVHALESGKIESFFGSR
ncbi:NHLP-related RiPP peptide [Xanthomonas sp. A2111]|uniref:NHLP-related RiPP peptide n=1 Tax=Xanthomonas hawaiiensis TaxID=3003247 RepID=UPI001ADA768B|nr:NHLP-related RiPP peptide [Xanthomonas sp. A2111]MBO9873367.1 NHLP-related RiPP peptide [Xanthomonas sp. D-93]